MSKVKRGRTESKMSEENIEVEAEANGFDSLKTALIQCVQVRDEDIIKSLLKTEVYLCDTERMKIRLSIR